MMTAPKRLRLASEALLLLGLARLGTAALPFRRVAALAGRRAAVEAAPEELIRAVVWAVDAAGRRAPWRVKCFERGLAAQAMLRRRGCRATLFYGARGGGRAALSAHVWVRSGERDVVGCDEAAGYAELARYPAG